MARRTAAGTHPGPMMGVPPTGIAIFRVAGGKLAETLVASALPGLLRQIGAGPPS